MLSRARICISTKQCQLYKIVMGQTSAVGEFAIVTNHGIILTHGAIINDPINGAYYRKDSELTGSLLAFKLLFTEGTGDCINSTEFLVGFYKAMSPHSAEMVWTTINDLLSASGAGHVRKNLKIHAIINMKRGCYGISYNDHVDKQMGSPLKEGTVTFDKTKRSLVLEVNRKRLILSHP